MKFLIRLALTLAALGLTGCATTYLVQVSALANPDLAAADRTYTFVANPSAAQNPGDLQFQEVLRQVQQALATAGFRATSASPALSVFVDFGVGNPVTHTYTFATPVYDQVGGGYSTRTRETKDASGAVTRTTEVRRYDGSFQQVGTDVTVGTVTTYRKYLRLTARQRATGVPADRGREVWTVTAIFDDEHADLRAALPLLTAAIAPYAGRDTHRAIIVELRLRDGRLVTTVRD